MKPVRFLFYIFVSFFVPDRPQRLIAFPSFELSDQRKHCIDLFSHNMWTKKQRINLLLLRRFVFRMVWQRGVRETRVTGDDAQGTKGRVKKGGLAPSLLFSPSRLLLRANFHRARDVWVRGRQRIVNGLGASDMNYSLVTFNCDVWQIS